MQRSRERGDGPWYEQAEAAYRAALKLDPRQVGALVGMAWVSNSRHEFDDGRRWAREALAVDPRVPEAHALLGDAAVELGEYDAAFNHYQACLDLRPDLSSYARAAHLLWLTGDAERAKALMRKAIASGSPHAENTAWCRAELALMMFNGGALALAEKHLEAALRDAPGSSHLLAAMGRIKTGRKDYASAVDLYERALSTSVPQSRTMAALVELYGLTENQAKAEAMYRRVLDFHASQDKRHAQGHNGEPGQAPRHGNAELARFLCDQNREPGRALEEATAAYQQFKNVYVADTLAWCHYRTGDYEAARSAIHEALRWHTPDAGILFHAGMIHAAAGDRETARSYLYQALNLNPNFHPVGASTAAEKLRELGSRPAQAKPEEAR
jgi:tetratricopeptide (TPR) repeat protein